MSDIDVGLANPYLTEQLVAIELERQQVLHDLERQAKETQSKLAWLRSLEERLRQIVERC